MTPRNKALSIATLVTLLAALAPATITPSLGSQGNEASGSQSP
jgi:hypothetical protein